MYPFRAFALMTLAVSLVASVPPVVCRSHSHDTTGPSTPTPVEAHLAHLFQESVMPWVPIFLESSPVSASCPVLQVIEPGIYALLPCKIWAVAGLGRMHAYCGRALKFGEFALFTIGLLTGIQLPCELKL
jgi:hypothetical protein